MRRWPKEPQPCVTARSASQIITSSGRSGPEPAVGQRAGRSPIGPSRSVFLGACRNAVIRSETSRRHQPWRCRSWLCGRFPCSRDAYATNSTCSGLSSGWTTRLKFSVLLWAAGVITRMFWPAETRIPKTPAGAQRSHFSTASRTASDARMFRCSAAASSSSASCDGRRAETTWVPDGLLSIRSGWSSHSSSSSLCARI